MSSETPPLLSTEYERMAEELESMAEVIRTRPEINQHFAERLALLAKEMRDSAVGELKTTSSKNVRPPPRR